MLKKLSGKTPTFLKNKYVFTALCGFLWVAFLDNNNLLSQISWHMELSQIQSEKAYYVTRIKEVKEDYKNLSSDMENLERFARERYFMKKPNEDIFIIVDKSK
jgi:cell division protein DivIC